MRKQALIRQIGIVKMETDVINMKTLIPTFVKSMSTIETLEPILTYSTMSKLLLSQLLNYIIPANADNIAIADHIHAVLLLNNW